jgi:hypothetical protein
MENVVSIPNYVNDTLVSFQLSEKPRWAADERTKRADRYASAWHQNQRLLASTEQSLNTIRKRQQGLE